LFKEDAMSRIQNVARAALIAAVAMSAHTVLANGVKTAPEPKTSTGRELTGPGAHHEEYTASPSDTARPRVDTVREVESPAIPAPAKRRKGAGAPVPGVDDKSSTRPGE
jgi:hypothetical protein